MNHFRQSSFFLRSWFGRACWGLGLFVTYISISGFFFIIPLPKNPDPQRLRDMEQKGDWQGMLSLAEERLKATPVAETAPSGGSDPTNPRGRIANDPSAVDPGWYQIKGYALFKMQRWSECIDAYKLHLNKSPNSINSLQNLGSAYSNSKRYGEALEVFGKLTGLRPDLARAWYELGQANFHLGNVDRARQIHEEVKRRDSVLAAAYEQNFLKKVAAVPAPPSASVSSAVASNTSVSSSPPSTADVPMAIGAAQQAVAKDPSNSPSWIALGRAYMDAKQNGEAKRALEEALRIQPGSVPALYELGRLASLGGDKDKVREIYQQVNLRDSEKGAQFFKEFVLP